MHRKKWILGLLCLLLLVCISTDAAASSLTAANQTLSARDLNNPETFIMGTQYDRRFGSEADELRAFIYTYLTHEVDAETKAAYSETTIPANLLPDTLSPDDYWYRSIAFNLRRLHIVPERIDSYVDIRETADGYSILDVKMFLVDGVWYLYDDIPWELMMLEANGAPKLEPQATDDVTLFYGTWLCSSLMDIYGRPVFYDEDEVGMDAAFSADGTITTNGESIPYLIDGNQLALDGEPLFGYRFADANTLYLIEAESGIVYIFTRQGAAQTAAPVPMPTAKATAAPTAAPVVTHTPSPSPTASPTPIPAAEAYPTLSLTLPHYKQKYPQDCGIAAMSMAEGYLKGYTDADADPMYAGVLAYTKLRYGRDNYDLIAGISQNDPNGRDCIHHAEASYCYLCIENIAQYLQTIYQELEAGRPVIIHRTNGSREHWGVIYRYQGSPAALEMSGFMVQHAWGARADVRQVSLSAFLQGDPDTYDPVCTINRILFMNNGIAGIPYRYASDASVTLTAKDAEPLSDFNFRLSFTLQAETLYAPDSVGLLVWADPHENSSISTAPPRPDPAGLAVPDSGLLWMDTADTVCTARLDKMMSLHYETADFPSLTLLPNITYYFCGYAVWNENHTTLYSNTKTFSLSAAPPAQQPEDSRYETMPTATPDSGFWSFLWGE